MNSLTISALLFVLTVTFREGLALKCWRCSSDARGAEFCKDPFDDSIVTEKQREWSYVQCNEPVSADQISHGIVAACKKLVQRVHGQLVVKRSCSLEKEDADKNDCSRPTKFSFIQTISCETCRVDGCNGAIEEEEEEEKAPQAPLIDPEQEDPEEDEAEDENDEFNDDNEDEEEDQTNDDNEQEEIHSQKENLVRRTEDVVPNDSDLEVEASEKRSSKGNSGESIKLNFVVGGFVLLLALQH